MNKLKKILLFVGILTLSLFIMVGCNKEDVDKSIPTSLSLSQNEVTLLVGENIHIEVTPTPSEASNEVIWTTSNQDIVDVVNGEITGVAEGNAIVTATSIKNENIKATVTVNVIEGEFTVAEIPDTLCVGDTYNLEVSSTYGAVSFVSLNEDIATIDENGLITTVTKGTVTIKIISVDYPSKFTTVQFKVYNIPTELKTSNKTTEIFIGRSTKFNLTARPTGALAKVHWESSDPSVLQIDENGVATGIKEGSATIKGVSVVNPDIVFERVITVLTPAESVEIIATETSGYIGETIQLSAQVYPLTVANTVTWRSPDESVATVNENGLVTITGNGQVTISASSTVTPDIKCNIVITGLHDLLENEEPNVRYIITGVGEDASTSININYHADNTKTSIEYTVATDTDFVNAITCIPEGRYLEELSEAFESPFVGRNVFSCEINDLTPGTDYIYRINCGDGTYSDVYHFTTAEGKGNNFSFLWLTDNHYHDAEALGATYLYAEEVIQQAQLMRPELAFVFDTGDMIDRGGSANIWDVMFTNRHTLKELPLMSTTGNHELYINGTGQTDNRFHAAYNALPKNGVEGKVGTSCYFFYNDVLLILIENVHPSSYNEQLEWLDDILSTTREENSARLIIMGMHKPIQSENPSYMAQDRDENIMALCDKYSVDLVLTGHYHSQNVVRDYYEGVVSNNPLLGTNYMIGNSSRLEGRDAEGYIVDVVDGNKIVVTHMNHLGEKIESWEFNTKKEEAVSDEAKNTSKQQIMDSISYTLNSSVNQVIFNWTKNAYGNVSKINIYETLRNNEQAEAYIINEAYTKLTINNLYKYYDGLYKVVVTFNDGTILEKEFYIKHDSNLNHTISSITDTSSIVNLSPAHSSIEKSIKYYEVYLNGELIDTIDYIVNLYPIEKYGLSNLQSKTEYEVKFVAYNSNKEIMFYNSVEFITK